MVFIFRILLLVQYAAGVSKNVVGYVSEWGAEDSLPFDKLTHINYGVGLMLKTHPSIYIEAGQREKMQSVLKVAKGRCKSLFSIGGWVGSQTFSTMANHDATVDMFIDDALNYLREDKGYGFDGLDIDWEYPGVRLGSKCNFNSTADTKNYLKLLQKLRKRMDKEFNGKKLLTAAVRVITFDDENSVPLRDVKEFAKVLDFVNIKAYDMMGAWSNRTGPNAPIYPLKESRIGEEYRETQLSLATAVRDWTTAGFPPSKLNAGIALYGRVTTALKAPTGFLEGTDGVVPRGDGVQSIDGYCGEGFLLTGIYRYKHLRRDILVNAYNEAKPGFMRKFDSKTKTPYIIDEEKQQLISYEDLDSTRAKIDFINEKGLGGAMVFDLTMDYNNEIIDALQAIRPKETFEPSQETPPPANHKSCRFLPKTQKYS
ncbi:hypothetical protein DSO57_1031097 [Entomophthora muscae]|uniref:Uncharacterized protein n=1 Tax=Entomophthora muscae TaxID=34485 RepID=A0ACC2UMR5_9FUNG|nr:hypothetical protein DSO57_1031097 [Entomophthora muscae]